MSPLLGRRVRHTTRGYGNTAPETVEGTIQTAGWDALDRCIFIVLLDDGALARWVSLDCKVLPESSLIPAWALPHIPAALGGGIILVASVVGAYCLAGVM